MDNYFHPSHRLDYGSLLYPEQGYELDFAVGCTYSLDFEALISVPVFLGALEQPGSTNWDNPYILLEGIRRSSEKIALFCNSDGIKMMQYIKPVYALLENSVFPVNLGAGKNFHPKLWVIRYKSINKEPDIIKIIILSRNLTFDRSMDIAVELIGRIKRGANRQMKHAPIADLLRFLANNCDVGEKHKSILDLANSVLKVDTFEIDDPFSDYDFFVTGIPNHRTDSKEICRPCQKIMVVSPFLTKSALSEMLSDCLNKSRNGQTNRILISRAESVTKEIFDMFDEVYVPKDGLEDNSLLEEVDDSPKRNLHAKIIFKETRTENCIFLGSFNATSNARDRNVEIMVKFRYKPYTTSLRIMKESFVDEKFPAFQPLLSVEESQVEDDNEEMTDFSDVLDLLIGGEVKINENGSFSLIIRCKANRPDIEVIPLYLFKSRKLKRVADEIVFENMTIKELSEFIVVKKEEDLRILKINVVNMPYEERNNAIINSIIDSKTKFLQYILYLLSDEPELATIEMELTRLQQNESDSAASVISPTIYEKLLLAAARDPRRIYSIREVMDKLSEDTVDSEFRGLMACFEGFVEN